MSQANMFDPEISALFVAMAEASGPAVEREIPERGDVLGLRKMVDSGLAHIPHPDAPNVPSTSYRTTAPDGIEIELRWYSSDDDKRSDRPAVVYLHGGGRVAGSAELYEKVVRYYVQETKVPVLQVDYRLAPECTGTTAPEDGFAGLQWLISHADELGVDPARIAVMGDSGGGGVAAGIAILARDRDVNLAMQILIYPMLDDRNTEPDPILEDMFGWTHDNNWTCWTAVLGDNFGCDTVSPVAAPARLKDFAGLPAAYVEVGDLDIFRDECIAYAQQLYSAHISCELHILPGVIHGHDLMSFDLGVTQRTLADRCRVISAL